MSKTWHSAQIQHVRFFNYCFLLRFRMLKPLKSLILPRDFHPNSSVIGDLSFFFELMKRVSGTRSILTVTVYLYHFRVSISACLNLHNMLQRLPKSALWIISSWINKVQILFRLLMTFDLCEQQKSQQIREKRWYFYRLDPRVRLGWDSDLRENRFTLQTFPQIMFWNHSIHLNDSASSIM